MSPDLLPPIDELRRIAQSLAMLDAIICQEWEFRFYSYNAAWGREEEMASMRNGSGDHWFLWFASAGAALKGFVHEIEGDSAFPEKMFAEVPTELSAFLSEPAFDLVHATFCYWRRTEDIAWSRVSTRVPNDGSEELLSLLVSGPLSYQEWAREYFEISVQLEGVVAVFNHVKLSDALIKSLNPGADISQVLVDAAEIGYPYNAA